MKTDPNQKNRPWHFWDLVDVTYFVAFLHLMPCRPANVPHQALSGDVDTTCDIQDLKDPNLKTVRGFSG